MAELDYNYIGELVGRAKSGDSDAFAELYATTYQRQYLFSLGYLKDEFLAQDALQETYINALKNLITLKDSKLFVSWLNQINFRVCYTMAAKQKKYNAEMEEMNSEYAEDFTDEKESPEEEVIKVDNKEYIMQQVLSIPYSESQAILLHYFQDMTIDDIAYIMDVSRSTVKRYLDSGKKRLAKNITQ